MSTKSNQHSTGRGTKPRKLPRIVNGRRVPNAMQESVNNVSHFPGRLEKKGIRLVLITNMTKTSVQNDYTNHPLWKSPSDAPNTKSIIP